MPDDKQKFDPKKRLGSLDDLFDLLGKNLLTGGTEAKNRQLSTVLFPELDPDVRALTGQHLVGSEFAGDRFGAPLANLGGLAVEGMENVRFGTNALPEGQRDTALDLLANRFGQQIAAAETPEERAALRIQAEDQLKQLNDAILSGEVDPLEFQREVNPIGARIVQALGPPPLSVRARLQQSADVGSGRIHPEDVDGFTEQLLRLFSGGGVTADEVAPPPITRKPFEPGPRPISMIGDLVSRMFGLQ